MLPLVCSCLMAAAASCTRHDVYQSTCHVNQSYKKLTFKELVAHPEGYNGQYVEVSGKYVSGKDQAALTDSSTIYSINRQLLWIDFSPDCPLYQQKTHAGLFENYSIYKKMDGRLITMRGRINTHNHGYHHQYKAALEQVSLLKW